MVALVPQKVLFLFSFFPLAPVASVGLPSQDRHRHQIPSSFTRRLFKSLFSPSAVPLSGLKPTRSGEDFRRAIPFSMRLWGGATRRRCFRVAEGQGALDRSFTYTARWLQPFSELPQTEQSYKQRMSLKEGQQAVERL